MRDCIILRVAALGRLRTTDLLYEKAPNFLKPKGRRDVDSDHMTTESRLDLHLAYTCYSIVGRGS